MSKWEIFKIGDVCKTSSGGTPLKLNNDYYDNGDIPWLVSGEVCQKNILNNKNYITQKGLENSSAKLFPVNTVLVAMYGATAGQVGILRFESATNQAICGILPNKRIIPEFLYYALLFKKSELIAQATGNAQPNISQIKIKNTKIPVPPIEEQKRIVEILDKAFEGIAQAEANTRRNLINARELFDSYLNKIFADKDKKWIRIKLSKLCNIKHGFAFKSEFFTRERNKYILLTPGSFYENGGYREQGEKTKYYTGEIPEGFVLKKNDFLIVMTEQAVGLLGSSLSVSENNKFLHNQRLGLVQVFDNIDWYNDFFLHQFNTKFFRNAVQESASGVKVRHTSPQKLGAITVLLPPSIEEQKKIAKNLNDLKEETKKLETIYQRKLEAIAELKQSILEKAFTGQLSQ
ncbi:restriction endonuclease subunit S [Microcystis aeruginosa LEGE 11464]|jgi:type I restriction enzyme S subunit|uniref:restriction endonuclease subunit S n=1 Tax=Microcystis aeruginosa TaxID=1126 RepID=UPI001881A0F0|nr:restriction endonuclease subunit S [Microcystis aeruginosa]MBE9088584.1 restriction endonuclease subunit S [Microcystis aeruginosa LEGE 11464]MCZ8128891.1 restriction endonuclease subunit S [Microcystis sp. LE19-114.1B]